MTNTNTNLNNTNLKEREELNIMTNNTTLNDKERRGNKMRNTIIYLLILLTLTGCTKANAKESADTLTAKSQVINEVSKLSLNDQVSDLSIREFKEKYIYMPITEYSDVEESITNLNEETTIDISDAKVSNKSSTINKTNKSTSTKATSSSSKSLDTSDWRIALAYEWQDTMSGSCTRIASLYAQAVGTSDNVFNNLKYGKVSSPYFGCIVTYPGHYATYLADGMCLHGGWSNNSVKVASCTLGSSQPITGYYDPIKATEWTNNHSYNQQTNQFEEITNADGSHNHTFTKSGEISTSSKHIVTWICNTCGYTYDENLEIDPSKGNTTGIYLNDTANQEHTHNYIEVRRTNPCVNNGYVEYLCSICGDYKNEILPATRTEHDYILQSTYIDHTCTVVNVYKCSICGQGIENWTGIHQHNLVNGRCTNCTYEDPTDPSYNNSTSQDVQDENVTNDSQEYDLEEEIEVIE